MGTQVQCKSYLGGHKHINDRIEDCKGNGWHLFYGEKNLGNLQYQTTFIQRTVEDAHTGHDKNGLKRKILEHDAIFKNQVHELHRLYRTQRDMMVEIKPKEGHRHGDLIEPLSSTSLQGPQAENGGKWHISSYPVVSSVRSDELGTDNVTSPLSCSKEITSSQILLQNGCSKDNKVSGARPAKVRKKLIDLQLPADEFSDTEEAEQQDTNTFHCSKLTHNQEYNIRLESSVEWANGGFIREKMESLQEGCIFHSNTRMPIGLADLNEPVEVEEATELSSTKIFSNYAQSGTIKGIESSAKSNSGFLGLPRDVMQKPGHFLYDSLNDLSTENNVTRNKLLTFQYEAAHAEGSRKFVSRSVQQDKLSFHAIPSKALIEDHPGVHFANHIQETLGKERMSRDLEGTHKSQDYAIHTRRDLTVDGQLSNSFPFLGSSSVSNTRPPVIPPWGKPENSLSPKLTSLNTQKSPEGLNKTLQSSGLNNAIMGDKWYVNNSSRPNPGLIGDPPSCNGVFHGSSSGSKDSHGSKDPPSLHTQKSPQGLNKTLQSSGLNNAIMGDKWYVNNSSRPNPGLIGDPPPCNGVFHGSSSGSKDSSVPGFDCLLCSRSDNLVSSRLVNPGMVKACRGYSCMDVKPLKDFNLNETLPRNALKDAVAHEDLEIVDGNGKLEGHKPSPPCLRTEQAYMNEAANSEINVISINASPPKMILGVPIYEKFGASENEAASLLCSTPERENAKQEEKNYIIDINVTCDAPFLQAGDKSDIEEVVNVKPLGKSSSVRYFIDLNSDVTEDEDLPTASAKSTVQVRFVADFDLEALAVPEEDDLLSEKEIEQNILQQLPNFESEQLDDELLMSAAKTIVDMFSCQDRSCEKSSVSMSGAVELESLLWFADVAASSGDQLENSSDKECSCKEMDDFEVTTLLLPDTNEEDYMPKPFVIEAVQVVEEAGGNSLPTRPRRNQVRRGRQRKDFQRDILPVLACLSRHEMTEDLQTFGGLMRATGHAWRSGSTRRNGGTRGRRRKAVKLAQDSAPVGGCTQQMTNLETNLEDRRSLTGWGRTTRRPRRQRCPVSNAPSLALS